MNRYIIRNFAIFVSCLVLIFVLVITRQALPTHAASPSLTLSALSGPPTTSVTVNGIGFSNLESVTLNFDNTVVSTSFVDNTGAFTSTIAIPSGALPGNHTITAIGTSGDSSQAFFLVQTNWTMFGFDASHSSYNPYENVLTTANVFSLVQKWSSTPASPITSPPVVANGLVYIYTNDGTVSALNAINAAKIWSYHANSTTPRPSLAVSNGRLYFGSGSRLYALNANTGSFLWKYIANGTVHSPTVAGGLVYFGTDAHSFYALDAATGALLWTFQTNPANIPAVANGIIYVAKSHVLFALNANTGSQIWSQTSVYSIVPPLETANGAVYYFRSQTSEHGGSEKVIVRNATTGAFLWTRIGGALSVANGVAYLCSDPDLLAINAATNRVLWTTNGGGFDPTIANGVVYTDSGALNASTGEILWTSPVTGYPPVVTNGVVYILGFDGNLYAFHLPGTSF